MKSIAIIYWSGTGNTQAMAEAIAQGIEEEGKSADLMEVSEAEGKDITAYQGVLLGCPSMGDEVLEEGEFEPFYTAIENDLQNKQVGLFGSYGWGDGQWMRDWEERAKEAGLKVFEEGLIVNETDNQKDIDQCMAFGKRFAGL